MRKTIGFTLMLLSLLLIIGCNDGNNRSISAGVFEEPTVEMCHVPDGEATETVTLLVPESEVESMLADGASMGACADSPSDDGDDPDGDSGDDDPGDGDDDDEDNDDSGDDPDDIPQDDDEDGD